MRIRLLVSAYTGLILYLVTMFFFGGTGHFAYQNLKKQSNILEKNVESLRVMGRKLGYSVTALQSDSGSILKAGRRLLLLRSGEGIIRVAGYRERPKPLSPGRLVVLKKDADLQHLEPHLRTFALVG
ncbi:MAG: septum formation initiator family protein, partial [Spirochaetaceae bacterium]|nr:septum formation initiator family protein [Spirochaetaceae bacterium]